MYSAYNLCVRLQAWASRITCLIVHRLMFYPNWLKGETGYAIIGRGCAGDAGWNTWDSGVPTKATDICDTCVICRLLWTILLALHCKRPSHPKLPNTSNDQNSSAVNSRKDLYNTRGQNTTREMLWKPKRWSHHSLFSFFIAPEKMSNSICR